jgi:hypothetical protein
LLKYGFVVIVAILFLGIVFGSHNYSLDYDTCIDLGNSDDGCSKFIYNAQTVSQILDLSYVKVQNLLSYVSCVNNEKDKSNFDYRSIKNICYGAQNDNAQSSFKSRCFYKPDINANSLTVNCKGVFPSEDYSWDLVLQTDVSKNVNIEPKIILNPNFTINGTKLGIFSKTLDLSDKGITLTNNTKIYTLPLAVEVRDTNGPLKSLFEVNQVNNSMDPIYRSYLDCITIHILMAQPRIGDYLLKKSGLSYPQTADQIFGNCKDLVTYAFAIDLEKYDEKKNMFLDMINVLVNNYLNDSNFSVDSMNSYFDSIDAEYRKYASFESQINNNKDVSLKLSLDADYFLAKLQSATKGLSEEERKTVLASAGPTLLKNKEDTLSVRRKTNLSSILDYFKKDQANITDKELKQIYSDIEYNLIKNHFETSDVVDLTDVSAKLSAHSIAFGDFSFDFVKPMQFDYLGDKNYPVVLTKLDNIVLMKLPDYNINTALSLGLENNSIFIGTKEITFLDSNLLKSIASGNVEITNVDLELDGDLPMFVVHQQVLGKLLGIIKIKELVESRYFATTGILSKVSKPWWDFLVVYI